MKKKAPKKRAKAKPKAKMVKQPHGGALKVGNPGNRGGGTITTELRQVLRGDLVVARDRVIEILQNKDAEPRDIIAIFDKLAKYSIGEKRDAVLVDVDLLNEFFNVVQRFVSTDEDLKEIREAWLAILAKRLRA